jgi:hypothetical protein
MQPAIDRPRMIQFHDRVGSKKRLMHFRATG